VAWVVVHGLLHGLFDPTWTGYEMLIVLIAVTFLGMRYYRRRQARLRRRLTWR